jgi:glycosyltransferase involved in cell wall biosynthesis
MACRCPLISTKVGGPEDIVQQGINGFLCEIDDVNDLANKVIQILNSSEEEWQYLSKSALETATKYTWDDAANLFEKVLEKCIESSLNKDIP